MVSAAALFAPPAAFLPLLRFWIAFNALGADWFMCRPTTVVPPPAASNSRRVIIFQFHYPEIAPQQGREKRSVNTGILQVGHLVVVPERDLSHDLKFGQISIPVHLQCPKVFRHAVQFLELSLSSTLRSACRSKAWSS